MQRLSRLISDELQGLLWASQYATTISVGCNGLLARHLGASSSSPGRIWVQCRCIECLQREPVSFADGGNILSLAQFAQHACSQPPSLKLLTIIQPGAPNDPVPLLDWLRAANEHMGGDNLVRRQLCVYWSGFGDGDRIETPNCWRSATIRRIDKATGACEIKYHDDRHKHSQAFLYLPLSIVHFARCPPAPGAAPRNVADGQTPLPPFLPQRQDTMTPLLPPPFLALPSQTLPSASAASAANVATTTDVSSFPQPPPPLPPLPSQATPSAAMFPAAAASVAASAPATAPEQLMPQPTAPGGRHTSSQLYYMPYSCSVAGTSAGLPPPPPTAMTLPPRLSQPPTWPQLIQPLNSTSEMPLQQAARSGSSRCTVRNSIPVVAAIGSPGTPTSPVETPSKRPWPADICMGPELAIGGAVRGAGAVPADALLKPPTKLPRAGGAVAGGGSGDGGGGRGRGDGHGTQLAATAGATAAAASASSGDGGSGSGFACMLGNARGRGGTAAITSAFWTRNLEFRNSSGSGGDSLPLGISAGSGGQGPRAPSSSLPTSWPRADDLKMLQMLDTVSPGLTFVPSSSSSSLAAAAAMGAPAAPQLQQQQQQTMAVGNASKLMAVATVASKSSGHLLPSSSPSAAVAVAATMAEGAFSPQLPISSAAVAVGPGATVDTATAGSTAAACSRRGGSESGVGAGFCGLDFGRTSVTSVATTAKPALPAGSAASYSQSNSHSASSGGSSSSNADGNSRCYQPWPSLGPSLDFIPMHSRAAAQTEAAVHATAATGTGTSTATAVTASARPPKADGTAAAAPLLSPPQPLSAVAAPLPLAANTEEQLDAFLAASFNFFDDDYPPQYAGCARQGLSPGNGVNSWLAAPVLAAGVLPQGAANTVQNFTAAAAVVATGGKLTRSTCNSFINSGSGSVGGLGGGGSGGCSGGNGCGGGKRGELGAAAGVLVGVEPVGNAAMKLGGGIGSCRNSSNSNSRSWCYSFDSSINSNSTFVGITSRFGGSSGLDPRGGDEAAAAHYRP